MLRAVNDLGVQVRVLAWAMVKNGWEYYITELPDEDGYGFAYVQGFESEFGSFSLDEIKPYLVMYKEASELSADPESDKYLAAPQGGRWMTPEEIEQAEAEDAKSQLVEDMDEDE